MNDDVLNVFNLWFSYNGAKIDQVDLSAALLAFDAFYENEGFDAFEMIACADALGFEPADVLLGLCNSNDIVDDDFNYLIGDDFDYDL